MSSTITTSNLSPYDLNKLRRKGALLSERTVPRTEKPWSRKALTTHTAMYPFAPETRTLPELTAGIVCDCWWECVG